MTLVTVNFGGGTLMGATALQFYSLVTEMKVLALLRTGQEGEQMKRK